MIKKVHAYGLSRVTFTNQKAPVGAAVQFTLQFMRG